MEKELATFIETAFSLQALAGHLSYGLLVLSMLMSSIVWLRAIALVSGVAGVVYSGFVLHDPIGTAWESLFVLANLAQFCLLIWRSRRVRFSDEEFLFCQNALVLVPPFLARQFINIGQWKDIPAGTVLTQQDETVEQLTYIAEGHVEVTVNGRLVAACNTGDFVGNSASYPAGPRPPQRRQPPIFGRWSSSATTCFGTCSGSRT